MALHLVYKFFKIVMLTFALVAQVIVSPLLETIVKIVTKLPLESPNIWNGDFNRPRVTRASY